MGGPKPGNARGTILAVLVAFGIVFAFIAGVTVLVRALAGGPIIPERTEDGVTDRLLDEARSRFPDLEWRYRTAGRDGDITAFVNGVVDDEGTVEGITELLHAHETDASEAERAFAGHLNLRADGATLKLPHVMAPDDAGTMFVQVSSGTWDAVEIHGREGNVFTAGGCASDAVDCFGGIASSAAKMVAADIPSNLAWPGEGSAVEVRIPVETPLEYPGGRLENEIPGQRPTAEIHGGPDGEAGAAHVRSAIELLGRLSAAGAPANTGVDGDADIVPGRIVVGDDGPRSAELLIRETGNDTMPDGKQLEVLRTMIGILREAGGDVYGLSLSVTTFWSTSPPDGLEIDGRDCRVVPADPGAGSSPIAAVVRSELGCA